MSAAAAPDLITPVVAYRAWRVVGDRLLSPNIPVRWEGRVLHAACHPVQRRIMKGAQNGWVVEDHGLVVGMMQCATRAGFLEVDIDQQRA